MKIAIGIFIQAETSGLRATLDGLRAHTQPPHEILLLPDGLDQRKRVTLAAAGDFRQLGTDEPQGTPAGFNRLVASSRADIYLLLENGAVVGPHWLDHLMKALGADPRNGLAGPSTNRAWNEQCAFPNAGDEPETIARTAREAAERFGSNWRSLEPLYSLSDFCYAVRREVIESVGLADEGYGVGPCWEMDYNIRAARAGWRGVWVCGAYVHRAPLTPRRRMDEARLFDANKHRYQDKFCGARLRGEKNDYRSHCRGDSCQNFAPIEQMGVKRSLPTVSAVVASPTAMALHSATDSGPLVSCIMPTYNRRRFVSQAIRCFLRQDYSNTELIVVDDGTDPISDCVPEDARIRYIRSERKLTIGAKRNFACEQSGGEFIVHWDDDDWYPSWRIRVQLGALLDRGADLCGSSRVFYYDAATNRAWEYRYAAAGSAWVAGNTLAYRKSFWARNKFPNIQVGEDSRFVWSDVRKSLFDLQEPKLCVASIHRGNTSPKNTRGAFWREEPGESLLSLLGDDSLFYHSTPNSTETSQLPLVSCIMPTYNRRVFIPLALRYFTYQDYDHRELIVVDDGDQPVNDLVGEIANVKYVRLQRRVSIGAKRNIACQHASGEVIAHWDDDDWYAPDRLRYQVTPILAGDADITGLDSTYVLDASRGEFWTAQPELHKKMFVGNVHGGTLVYSKRLLKQGLHYPEINLAEDAWLLNRALRSGRKLRRLSNPGVFVYVRHGKNAWREFAPGTFINSTGWGKISPPPGFPHGSLHAYRDLTILDSSPTSTLP